jgi:hypothetical protein
MEVKCFGGQAKLNAFEPPEWPADCIQRTIKKIITSLGSTISSASAFRSGVESVVDHSGLPEPLTELFSQVFGRRSYSSFLNWPVVPD